MTVEVIELDDMRVSTGNYQKNVTVMIGSNEDDGLILTTSLTTDPSLYLLYRSVLSCPRSVRSLLRLHQSRS